MKNLHVNSVFGTLANGDCSPETYPCDWTQELIDKVESCETAYQLASIFHNILLSENCLVKSFLVFFNYEADDPKTARHLLVNLSSWTMVINKPFPVDRPILVTASPPYIRVHAVTRDPNHNPALPCGWSATMRIAK